MCKVGLEERGCMNQVFPVRQVCEKYLGKSNNVFWTFMDLVKGYERIDRGYMGC